MSADQEAIEDRIAPHTAKIIEAMRMWADNKIHIYELGMRVERELRALAATPVVPQNVMADARRYRHLRQKRPVLLITGYFGNGCVNKHIEDVDAAIDAELDRTEGPK